MADNISSRQNLPGNIQRLAAQRYLYSRAKHLSLLQAFLAGATPILAAIVVALRPSAEVWAAFAGVVVPLVDVGWLDPWQKRFREGAADIQEDFDCRVFELPWNHALAGHRPGAEEIHEAAKRHAPSSDAPLENWYPPAVSALPLNQGRLICQRTNCWWDSKLRRRYSMGIVIALIIVSAFVVLMGLITGMTLQKFVLAVIAPLSPAVLWGMRERQRQMEAASALDRLKEYGESLWDRVVKERIAEPEVSALSRGLQDAILFRRRDNPFVFDWIYRRLRKEYEEQMNVRAEAMVAETSDR